MKNIVIVLTLVTAFGCSSPEPVEFTIPPTPDENTLNQLLGITDSTDLPLDAFGPIDSVNADTMSIPGAELVGQLEVSNSASRDGINIQIVNYGFISARVPRITVRLDNTSALPIVNATCSLKLSNDDVLVGESSALLGIFSVIEAGESAVYPVPFYGIENGFDSVNQLDITCEWTDGNGDQIDVGTDPVRFEILDISQSSIGSPEVRVLATNNSGNTINRASCKIKAKTDNVILDSTSVLFGTVEPGEAREKSGIFFFFTSLAGFELDQFDESNMDCSYR